MFPQFNVVIPARFASTRLEGKPLRIILNKPMIQWAYEAAVHSKAQSVVVATDDRRIADCVIDFGGDVCMTSDQHQTGSDRLAEVAQTRNWGDDLIVVNLQGDEPLMPAVNMMQVVTNLVESNCDMATLHKIIGRVQALDLNQVKLIHDSRGIINYFSRSLIPFDLDGQKQQFFGHIGIYAYRVGFLNTFTKLPVCELETREKLEQLRTLWNGYTIHTELATESPGPGVDTEQDLQQVIKIIKETLND
jgi:3-deoxy-manno-octulosonate cytidylyltransferase (CMP-KDO synthetase)